MNNYSQATIEGYALQKPHLSLSQTGETVATFTVMYNHYNPEKEDGTRVSCIDLEAWGSVADMCKSLEKGAKLIVKGTLEQDRWERSDGIVASRIKIIASEVREQS